MAKLDEKLISKYRRFADASEMDREIAVAATAIRHLLNDDWFDNYLSLKTGYNPFFANSRMDKGTERYLYQGRIVQLGDLLFEVYRAGLGDWAKEKFSGLEPAPAFAELFFVAQALEDGKRITVPDDIRAEGGDFEIQITEKSFPVEVSLFTPETITKPKLVKKIKRKANQLPNREGIVALYIPLGSFHFEEPIQPMLDDVCCEIWKNRPNLIGMLLAWDFVLEQEGCAVAQVFNWFPNPKQDASSLKPNTDLQTTHELIQHSLTKPLSQFDRKQSSVLNYVETLLA